MTIPATALAVGVATHVGRVRSHNEDAAASRGPVSVVADGMGGHAAGEVASRIAVDTVTSLAERASIAVRDIVGSVEAANKAILESAARHPEQTGMGTTLAGIALLRVGGSDHWAVFNIGDSRVYRCMDGELSQITVDHSEVWELVEAGEITPEQARVHPGRNVITRSLGRDPMGAVDTWVFPPYSGDRFLVCSDGVSNELPDREIERLLREHEDAQAAADALVDAAVAAGGRDNATAIVVSLQGRPPEDDVAEETAPRESTRSA